MLSLPLVVKFGPYNGLTWAPEGIFVKEARRELSCRRENPFKGLASESGSYNKAEFRNLQSLTEDSSGFVSSGTVLRTGIEIGPPVVNVHLFIHPWGLTYSTL
jgi:hypothetical protein